MKNCLARATLDWAKRNNWLFGNMGEVSSKLAVTLSSILHERGVVLIYCNDKTNAWYRQCYSLRDDDSTASSKNGAVYENKDYKKNHL